MYFSISFSQIRQKQTIKFELENQLKIMFFPLKRQAKKNFFFSVLFEKLFLNRFISFVINVGKCIVVN